MIALAVAHFAFAGAQVKPENPKMAKMGLTATQLAHYMAPGVNLGNTMEACNWNDIFTNNAGLKSETSWQNDKTSESYIRSLKKQGFNSLRIPTSWVAGHLIDKQNMTIDPAWVLRIKEIVNYGLNAGLCVIINEHWDGGWMEHDAFTNQVNVSEHKEMYRKLWVNIANQFKEYDQRVLFAALNEPGVGGASPQAKGEMLAPDSKEFADRLLEYEQVFLDASGQEMFMEQGACCPVVRLHTLYGIGNAEQEITAGILLITEADGKVVGLLADALLGVQQIVVKPVPKFIHKLTRMTGITGCTLLGDGSISLIIDPAKLIGLV